MNQSTNQSTSTEPREVEKGRRKERGHKKNPVTSPGTGQVRTELELGTAAGNWE